MRSRGTSTAFWGRSREIVGLLLLHARNYWKQRIWAPQVLSQICHQFSNSIHLHPFGNEACNNLQVACK